MLITIAEAAMLTKRTPQAIYQWVKANKLRAWIDTDGLKKVDARETLAVERTIRRSPNKK